MKDEIISQLNRIDLEKSIKTELLSTTIFDADLCQGGVGKELRRTTLIEDLVCDTK